MKVLLLPTNISSDISHKVAALREHGIDARGLVLSSSKIQSDRNVDVLEGSVGGRFENRRRGISNFLAIWRGMRWADVVHWTCVMGVLPRRLDEFLVKRLNKPRVVQWYGSDIRDPEIESRRNPFYAQAFANGYEYDNESSAFSRSTQERFANLGFFPIEFRETMHYLRAELFPVRFVSRQMVNLADHPVCLPEPSKRKPMVVHAPSAPVAKGTRFVLDAVQRLKQDVDFDFQLVENMPHEQALGALSRCDIFIDQLVLGSHGYAAVEAMAFGKPVVCYINAETGKAYPPELPIVNANPENIEVVLDGLLRDGERRRELGRRSREYVEKFHDGRKVTADLISIYERVIELHNEK